MLTEPQRQGGRYENSARLLDEAIGLWREEPLAELRGARAEQLRGELANALLDAHKLLADCQLRMGRHDAVLARLEPLLRTYDVDEALAQYWVRALCAASRDEDARAFATTFRRRFRREMRVDPALTVPDFAERRPTAGSRLRPAGGRLPDPVAAPGPRQLPNDINDFTGHHDLLDEMDLLARPEGAGTNVMVIGGMPGVGKPETGI
jgi:hypothetical protein